MVQVNVHDAKTHFSELLARAERGEEVVIARAGRPVVKLEPFFPHTLNIGFADIPLPDDFLAPLSEDELTAWE